MSEIEVGDFVRTRKGIIGKLVNVKKSRSMCWEIRTSRGKYVIYEEFTNDTIVKHSKNIIDLIEVGDIVKVLVNIKTQETMIYTIDCESDLHLLREWNVKSIVTKEEFESREYKVGE